MRIAVLSDIHGVLPALEAVLAEPDVRSADQLVLTGDLAAGPQPVETLDFELGIGRVAEDAEADLARGQRRKRCAARDQQKG